MPQYTISVCPGARRDCGYDLGDLRWHRLQPTLAIGNGRVAVALGLLRPVLSAQRCGDKVLTALWRELPSMAAARGSDVVDPIPTVLGAGGHGGGGGYTSGT